MRVLENSNTSLKTQFLISFFYVVILTKIYINSIKQFLRTSNNENSLILKGKCVGRKAKKILLVEPNIRSLKKVLFINVLFIYVKFEKKFSGTRNRIIKTIAPSKYLRFSLYCTFFVYSKLVYKKL